MTSEQFDREKLYRITLSLAKTMLEKGLITVQDYNKIDGMMLEKYRPLLGVLIR